MQLICLADTTNDGSRTHQISGEGPPSRKSAKLLLLHDLLSNFADLLRHFLLQDWRVLTCKGNKASVAFATKIFTVLSKCRRAN